MQVVTHTNLPIIVQIVFWLFVLGVLGKLGFGPLIQGIANMAGYIVGKTLFLVKELFFWIFRKLLKK